MVKPNAARLGSDSSTSPSIDISSSREMLQHIARPVADFPEPQNIMGMMPPVLELTPQMVPDPFRQWAVSIARNLNVPLVSIVVALLAMLSALIACRIWVYPKRHDANWNVAPILWGFLVAQPGAKKTDSIMSVLKLCIGLIREAGIEYEKDKAKFAAEDEVAKAKADELKARLKTATKEMNNELIASIEKELENQSAPEKPALKRFYTNDPTTEALVEIAASGTGRNSFMVLRDEIIGLAEALKKPGREGDKGFYLESFNGVNSFTQDRIGRGSKFIKCLCLSIFGTVQPDKLVSHFTKDAVSGGNDGWIQRFQLAVWPDPLPYAFVDEAPNAHAVAAATEVVERLAEMNFTEYGANPGIDGNPPFYKFSDSSGSDAQSSFIEWLEHLEVDKIGNQNETDIMREHFSKYRSFVPKVALIIHVVEIAAGGRGGPITLEALNMAIELSVVFESHARRIYQQAPTKELLAVHSLARKISDGHFEDGMTARDIGRKSWSQLDTGEAASAAAMKLVELDWLIAIEEDTAQGKKHTTRYMVNPRTNAVHLAMVNQE